MAHDDGDLGGYPRSEMYTFETPYSSGTDPISEDDLDLVYVGPRGNIIIDYSAMVDYLRKSYVVYVHGGFYCYNGCIYDRVTDEQVSAKLHKALDQVCLARGIHLQLMSGGKIRDVLSKARAVLDPVFLFNDVPAEYMRADGYYEVDSQGRVLRWDHLVAFRNGILNMTTGQLLPYTPDVFVTVQYGVNWEPGATCERAERIMNRIIPDRDTREALYRMIGYTIFAQHSSSEDASFFILYGAGGTGKSTLQKMITFVLGAKNVSNLDMTQLTATFSSNILDDKAANFCPDASTKGANVTGIDSGTLKAIAAGEAITVQRKGQQPYTIVPRAKLWFTANCLPDFGTVDSGMIRRIHIIKMSTKFTKGDHFQDVLYSAQALEWLVREAYEAYLRFREEDSSFADSKEMEEELEYYKMTDPVYGMLRSIAGVGRDLAGGVDGWEVDAVNRRYLAHCRTYGYKPLSKAELLVRLRLDYNITVDSVVWGGPYGEAPKQVLRAKGSKTPPASALPAPPGADPDSDDVYGYGDFR